MIDLGIEVVYVDMAGKLDFLYLGDLLLLSRFLLLLVALEAELAVVHDSTYGNFALRSDENEIVSLIVSVFKGGCRADNAYLLTVGADYTDLLLTAEAGEGEDRLVYCHIL